MYTIVMYPHHDIMQGCIPSVPVSLSLFYILACLDLSLCLLRALFVSPNILNYCRTPGKQS